MSKLTKEEQILKFLLDKNKSSKTNKVNFSRNDLTVVGLTEEESVKALCVLGADKHLHIISKSTHDDLSMYWQLELTSSGIHYFENKKEKCNNNIKQWIQFLIPLVVAIIAMFLDIDIDIPTN